MIEIKEGKDNLSAPTQEEEDFLGAGTTDERLACQCKIKSGAYASRFKNLTFERIMHNKQTEFMLR